MVSTAAWDGYVPISEKAGTTKVICNWCGRYDEGSTCPGCGGPRDGTEFGYVFHDNGMSFANGYYMSTSSGDWE